MTGQNGIIIEVEGVLGETLAEVCRVRIPLILEHERGQRVRMVVTTHTDHCRAEAQRGECLFQPARVGQPPSFTWTAAGILHGVMRQFRFDFIRQLGPDELQCRAKLALYLEESMFDAGSAEVEALPPPPASPVPAISAIPVMPVTLGIPAIPAVPDPPAPLADGQTRRRQIRVLDLQTYSSQAPVPEPQALNTADALVAEDAVELPWTLPIPLSELAQRIPNMPEPTPPTAEPETESAPALVDATNGVEASNLPEAAPEPDAPEPDAAAPAPDTAPRNLHIGSNPKALLGNFYQEYFGFECMPFNNTPDTHFFFPALKHQEALSRLLYAISERKGFVMISGEIGSGKSTLCRALLAQLPREVKTALITHTHLDGSQLVQAVAEDLGLNTQGRSRYEILQLLNEYLIEQMAAGCTVCIIIDEAQNLTPAALEAVRMVSNLETEQEKLVQLILLGQPELRDKIRLPEMRQLRQRISVQYHLDPLEREEAIAYIRHRLQVANPTQPLNFTTRAMHEVFRYSGGVPRLINSLCDNALLTAYTRQVRTIVPRLIREAGLDLDLEPRAGRLAEFFRFW